MNFSSSLMSGMGISLGGLEIATDFLFANPEFYEPDLTEIKSTISNKNPKTIQKNVKAVKPKVTKESIINKFSLSHLRPKKVADEILDNSFIEEDTEFDFNFELNELHVTSEEMENNEEILEANNLLQRLSSGIIEEDENNDEFSFEDLDDDIEIDINTNANTDDDLDIDNIDEDDDSNDLDYIDDYDVEDDFDIEDDSIEDDFDIEDDSIEDDFDDNIEDDDSFDMEDIDSLAFGDEDEINEENEDSTDLDSCEIDDIEFEDELDIEEPIKDISSTSIKNSSDNENTSTTSNSTTSDVNNNNIEVAQMRQKIANMEKQLLEMSKANTTKPTSTIRENKDSFDIRLNDAVGSSNKPKTANKYEMYNAMSIDALYIEVKKYMNELNVQKRTIDIVALNNKFGDINIRKLIQKSYLIKYGKGVTTGR